MTLSYRKNNGSIAAGETRDALICWTDKPPGIVSIKIAPGGNLSGAKMSEGDERLRSPGLLPASYASNTDRNPAADRIPIAEHAATLQIYHPFSGFGH